MNIPPIRPKDRFLVFGAPAIEEAEIEEVVASMRNGWLGTGPKVARFESDFRTYKDADQAVAVNSCTAALHLSILAAGIKPGDEVILREYTCIVVPNAFHYAGGGTISSMLTSSWPPTALTHPGSRRRSHPTPTPSCCSTVRARLPRLRGYPCARPATRHPGYRGLRQSTSRSRFPGSTR